MGLIFASRKFDASKGFKFSTYALYWIEQQMMAIMQKDRLVDGWSRAPLRAELAAGKTGMQQRAIRVYASEHTPKGEENELGLESIFPPTHEDHIERIDRQRRVRQVLARCKNPVERTIIRELLKDQTMEEIAKTLSVSRQRVHQIINPLLTRLRDSFNKTPADHVQPMTIKDVTGKRTRRRAFSSHLKLVESA